MTMRGEEDAGYEREREKKKTHTIPKRTVGGRLIFER